MWATLSRVVSSTTFLGAIIFTIPLAFDIGGRTCGLAFSLSLSAYYFLYSILRLATPDSSRFRWFLCKFVAWAQWLAIPTLLIWSLNKFSIDATNNTGWVERTFDAKRADFESVHDWIFGSQGLLQNASIGAWDKTLRYSTPAFQIAEGFCSLLVIQAAGQITRWVVNRERGDSWMVRHSRPTLSFSSTNKHSDWPFDYFCLHHLHLGLLPLAHHHFPRDQQRGRHSDWRGYYNCHLPWWMGHCQRERQSGRVVAIGESRTSQSPISLTFPVCLCHPLHLPNLHRLPAFSGVRCRVDSSV